MTLTAPATLISHALDQLAELGYTIINDFIPVEEVATLRSQAKILQAQGLMQQAAIGHDSRHQIVRKVRGDATYWLDETGASIEQTRYLARMHDLQQRLNRDFFLGLVEFESHFTIYQPGAVYLRHLDQFLGQQERQISAVLYLNDSWQAGDGGELRLYLDDDAIPNEIDISPLGGRLVLFLSGRFYHEVLASKRERFSLTGWFRTRSLTLP
jgi:SM-20-related protein